MGLVERGERDRQKWGGGGERMFFLLLLYPELQFFTPAYSVLQLHGV